MPGSEPLSTLMASGPMPVDEVVRIGRGAAESLGTSGVHGELWPSAIAVDDDRVGIVPPGTADRNRWGQYAAPERVLGKPATVASDVFSLAAILFHALAGWPAFRGESASAVMLAACTDVPRDLRESRSDVPIELSTAIYRALSKDPAQRFASMSVFRDALQAAPPRSAWPGRRILVADDDAPVRDLYTHVASRIGVEIDVVASGRDAIEALKTRKYDLALMDLNMPRLSGWEVLDFLRYRYDVRPRRLFIVTGFNDQAISVADRDVVSAVLYKPVVAEELRMLVTECLRGGELNLREILKTTSHRVSPAA
ncbi:MAG TPA: response regulator [Thermoanaerobaculia bacterium]|nr:response regulator [Thermoanaerobaculia bacterium]